MKPIGGPGMDTFEGIWWCSKHQVHECLCKSSKTPPQKRRKRIMIALLIGAVIVYFVVLIGFAVSTRFPS